MINMETQIHMPTAIIGVDSTVIKFRDSYECSDFSASLRYENERITLSVTPRHPMSFDELSVVGYADVTEEDRVFMNGYQSWTDSREMTINEKMTGIDHIPAAMVRKFNFDRYGDYALTRYSKKKGVFHGWTYAYVRRGDTFRLAGSVSERSGFTRIKLIADKKRIKLSRECQGAVYSEPFEAVDCALVTGSEEYVFSRWAEMTGAALTDGAPEQLRGYTSWYRHYQDISEEKLRHDNEALTASDMTADIFQIDDGYQTAVGDWLSIDKNKFPRGMKAAADRIHEADLKAGLWLAPFVCEKTSILMEQHPDWLMKDENGSPLGAGCNWSGSFALDLSNNEVRDYLRKVFDTVLNKWGFDLVKLDFLYAACILPHNGKSRGQLMCEAMDFLRELCGKRLILGCGVPLGAAFGKVDYCRIGCDVGLDWNDSKLMQLTHRERVSTKNSILNTVFRRQLSKYFFRNDPDVFLLRSDNIKLSDRQRQSLAIINHLCGKVLFTSDDVSSYTERQKQLYERAKAFYGAKLLSADLTDGVLTLITRIGEKRIRIRIDTADGKLI